MIDKKNKKIVKNLIAILYNLVSAYLVFGCFFSYPHVGITKLIGVIGLLSSYYVFHADVADDI